jgi:hypothetical protein
MLDIDPDDPCRSGEGLLDISAAARQPKRDVRAQLRMDQRRARFSGRARIDQGRQRLVGDLEQLGGVGRLGPRAGDDGRHRLADEEHPLARQQLGRRRSLVRHHLVDRQAGPTGRVGRGQHPHHARRPGSGRGVDRLDPGVCVRTPHEDQVERAGRGAVFDEPPLAAQQRAILDATDRLADVAARSGLGCISHDRAWAQFGT